MIILIMLIAMVLVVVISNNLIFETLNLHYQEIIILIFKYVHYKKITARHTITIVLECIQNIFRNFHIIRILSQKISMEYIASNNINLSSVCTSSITYAKFC